MSCISRFASRRWTRTVGALALGCLLPFVPRLSAQTDGSRERGFLRPAIQTDTTVYEVYVRDESLPDGRLLRRTVQMRSPIHYTFTNPVPVRLHVPACHDPMPPVLQQKIDGRWRTIYGAAVNLCLGAPLVIDSGAAYKSSWGLYGFLNPPHAVRRTDPEFEGTLPGTFRLLWNSVYDVWTPEKVGAGLGHRLPEALTVSNEFELIAR